jgi:hypothetical protein
MNVEFTRLFVEPGVCVYQPGTTYELSKSQSRDLIHHGIAKPKPITETASKNKSKRETR